eukprot:g2064.t1
MQRPGSRVTSRYVLRQRRARQRPEYARAHRRADGPATKHDAFLLGSVLRDKIGKSQKSIRDADRRNQGRVSVYDSPGLFRDAVCQRCT